MLKFEIVLEESTPDDKNAGDDSDVDEEEAKKKADAKVAKPKDEKKQEVVQELPPNTDLVRRNQELEHRLRDMTVETENLKI